MRYAMLLVLTMFGASLCFAAEVYPSKTVRVIVPFAPGGITDITARVISQQVSEQLGKPFVVENRTGASGTIGYAMVARSAPDGYTLMLADTSIAIVAGGLYKSLPFDVTKDFTPISQIVGTPNVFAVHPSLPVKSIKELVALAQANPGKLNYGSAGPGSAIHLFSELFKVAAKVNIAHIPYKGGAEAMAAVLGGQVEMLNISIVAALPHVKSGRLRALAVTTSGKRSHVLPDVPSMSEAGISGMTIYAWAGLMGPAGLPKEIVTKLHAEVIKALAIPSVQERFTAPGGEVVGNSPEEFTAHVRAELKRWAEVIKLAGIMPE